MKKKPVISFLLAFTIFFSMAATAFASTLTLASPVYPMFRHDAARTGLSSFVGSQSSTLKWAYPFNIGYSNYAQEYFGPSSPVVAPDGTIYVANNNGTIWALNPDGTYSTAWGWGCNPYVIPDGAPIESTPAIGPDGTIYVGSDDGNLTALYPYNTQGALPGSQFKWTVNLGGSVVSSPTLAPWGDILVASYGCVWAIYPSGTVDWQSHKIGNYLFSSPAVGPNGIYIGTDHIVNASLSNGGHYTGPAVVALTYMGKVNWVFPTKGWVESSPAVSNGIVYVGADDDNVYALNATNGKEIWQWATGGNVISSPAIGPDGTVYAASQDGKIYAFSPLRASFGQTPLLWTYQTMPLAYPGIYYPIDTIESSPAVGADGTIYIGCDDGNFYALNPNGSLKWVYNFGQGSLDYMFSSPAIGSDGTIYVVDNTGNLYAIGNPEENLAVLVENLLVSNIAGTLSNMQSTLGNIQSTLTSIQSSLTTLSSNLASDFSSLSAAIAKIGVSGPTVETSNGAVVYSKTSLPAEAAFSLTLWDQIGPTTVSNEEAISGYSVSITFGLITNGILYVSVTNHPASAASTYQIPLGNMAPNTQVDGQLRFPLNIPSGSSLYVQLTSSTGAMVTVQLQAINVPINP